jgi:hypothetical protein
MKNIVSAASQMEPYFAGKNLHNMAWMDPATRSAMLKKHGLPSALDQVATLVPQNTMNLFNPSNWAQALHNPSAQLFQRMLWAASVYDGAQAEVAEHKSKKKKKSAGMKEEEKVPDDELTAGELDENYNSPAAIEAQEQEEQSDKKTIVEEVLESLNKSKANTMSIAMLHLDELMQTRFDMIHEELGIADQAPMSDEEVRAFTAEHEGTPEHLGIRGFLLDKLSEQSAHFGLEHVAVADHFLNHLTASVMKSGKGIADLEKLSAGVVGKAFDQHIQSLSAAVKGMEQAAVSALKNQGAVLPAPAAAPQASVPSQINAQLSKMNAPDLSATAEMKPAPRMDQLRLAAIKLMFPNVPQPASALTQKLNQQVSHNKAEMSPHDSIKQEIEHYAKEIGVGLSTMGKAADRFLLQHIWPTSNPNHTATKALMQENPLAATPAEKPKTIMQKIMADSMKPGHQG